MKKRIHLKKRRKMDNRGATILETIIAFTVLMMILALLYQIVAFSSTLRMKANDTAEVLQTFNAEVYKKSAFSGKVKQRKYTSETNPSYGPLLYLRLSDKTNANNNAEAVTGERIRMMLSEIDLVCYYYDSSDTMVSGDDIVVPKVATFVHQKEK